MARFMLILEGKPHCYQHLSPDEMQRVFEKYRAWGDSMRATGRLAGGDKLRDEGGKIVSAVKGKVSVVDGPYSEAREVVGGYMMLQAESYEEAVALVSNNPHLEFGRITIRAVDPMGCGKDA